MKKLRIAVAALVATAAAAAPALAITSHVGIWRTKTVVCGLKIHQKSKPATTLLCSARGIPKRGKGAGDPMVQLTAHGPARLVNISQFSWIRHGAKLLHHGDEWDGVGVTCTVHSTTVACENQDFYGFVIGNGKYRAITPSGGY